ncbi:hypothetical protein JCM10207_005885 [Rhodosporidiobolus poonsookiae]
MLDQLVGKPSPSWRRTQVFLVLLFWLSRLALGPRTGPRLFFLRRLNRFLSRFTPWQVILSTLTFLYAVRHSDVLLGLQAPEPLARLYSRDYYRATWVTTALDAGFATAMSIGWKPLRDIASLAFSGYYLLFANEADEKLRKYRAFCTVEMLRVTWEKQDNPYIRFATRRHRPPVSIMRKVFLPRPAGSKYSKPITAYLYFNGTDLDLASQHELIMDLPGGGFICMNPEHHAERLLRWARHTGKVVLSFDYGKAPEYPFPFAIDEMYDAYSLLHSTKGKCIGMNSAGEKDLKVVLSGDSAGANIATAMVVKILETRPPASPSRAKTPSSPPTLPLPTALIFAYAALSFHFTSWMPSTDLRVLRSESHPDVASILRGKEHLDHRAPLSVVEDVAPRSAGSERGRPKVLRRKRTTSWGRGLVRGLPTSMSFAALRGGAGSEDSTAPPTPRPEGALSSAGAAGADGEEEAEEVPVTDETEKSLSERVVWWDPETGAGNEQRQKELQDRVEEEMGRVAERFDGKKGKGVLLGETRLAMTSRTAFFNDRIISPPMCRAMALLYIGPRNAPDLHSDYHISPIFTPPNLLAQFPPVYLSCGERDPFVDDTVIFAGKLREAKEARKLELLARESRHGETLRMSGRASTRDALLDETEDDWVRTSIIAGWSHGYLQMVSLLPAAEKVIDMMADWIDEAFEKAEVKEQERAAAASAGAGKAKSKLTPIQSVSTSPRASTPRVPPLSPTKLIKIMPPGATPALSPSGTSSFASTSAPRTPPSADAAAASASESEKEDDILTFTPRSSRRRGSSNASRAGSPSPIILPAQTGSALPARTHLVVPPAISSGDESSTPGSGASTTLPRTPDAEGVLSPPLAGVGDPKAAHRPTHLVTPAERALRDELAVLSPHARPAAAAGGTPPSAASATLAPGARRFFTEPTNTPLGVGTRPGSTLPASYLDAAHSHAHSPAAERKTHRSGSAGSLPLPAGAVFVDAKDLLRRRRDDVVFGISVSGSRAGSRDVSPGRAPTERSTSRDAERVDEEEDAEEGESLARRTTVA